MAPLKDRKFIFGMLLMVAVIVLQLRLVGSFPMLGFLVPATLIAFVFFFNFLEMIFFLLVSALLLNWQPIIGPEFLGIVACVVVLFFGRRVLPIEMWLQNVFAIAGAAVLFYGSMLFAESDAYRGVATLSLNARSIVLLSEVTLVSVVIGSIAFATLRLFHEPEI